MVAEARRRAIADVVRSAGSVTVTALEERFGVSPVTARRDLDELDRRGVLRRTHGGAVAPAPPGQEDSFALRLTTAAGAKRALADAAVALLAPRQTVFLDSSTTSYHVAERMLEAGTRATVLTNGLPVMELIAAHGGAELELIAVGGSLRPLTRSFVGPFAVRTVQGHFADRMFFSVMGVTREGTMTDADPLEAEVKRAMLRQAAEAVLLVDRSKLAARGLAVVAAAAEASEVIAHGAEPAEAAALRAAGAAVRVLGGADRHDA
jgi:DeoR/GlpR family transcriptional regulator of sugar metabolism